jgi:outer membrane protein TolC
VLCLAGLLLIPLAQVQAADSITLESALNEALHSNPEIAAYAARADAEQSAIRSQYSPDNPRFGLMRQQNMTFMQVSMGPMTSWTVTQEIKFPAKYLLMGSVQKAKASSAEELLASKKLEIRQRVISAYYTLFSRERILSLLEAQKETLKEVARIAETKHSTGNVPQQDEMKAHVEQTKIEGEILVLQEDRDVSRAKLNALLNREESESSISLVQKDLPIPRLNVAVDEIPKLAHSNAKHIRHGKFVVQEANAKRNLAYLDYAPDFYFAFQKPFINSVDNAYGVSVEVSIPLWFFLKQTSEVAVASAQQLEAEKNLQMVARNLHADVRSLTSKVKGHARLLEIYETSLIPQASSTLSSSRVAYQAGRGGFMDLLDSERSVYEVQIAYYRTIAQYVDDLAQLEEMVGASLSALPFGEVL